VSDVMEEINLKELCLFYFSKIAIILGIVIAFVLISCVYSVFFQTPKYRSSTTLVLASVNKSETGEGGITQNDITLNQKLVSTYREIIKSRRILGQVISNLGLNCSIESISGNITVTTEKDTELIRISVIDRDANNAKNIANEIASVFSSEIVKIYNIQNVAVIDRAEIATAPYNVNLTKQMIMAFLIGIIVACTFIFILYYFDTTIKSPEDIERKLALPILGSVPDVHVSKEGRK